MRIVLLWGSVGCDERLLITIWCQDRREYPQNTLRQHVETAEIEAACCTKHDKWRMRWRRVKLEAIKRPKNRRRIKLSTKRALHPLINNRKEKSILLMIYSTERADVQSVSSR